MKEILASALPAFITGAFALAAILLSARKTRRDLAHRVGDPNGKGNVTEMAERMLMHLGRQDEKTERVLTRLGRIESKQAQDHERLKTLEERSI